MPFASVDEHGTVLYYEDSGPPQGDHVDVYTTAVLIHGTYWNGGIFRKILPLGPEHGLRIITLNQRGFVSSTPLSAPELAQLTSNSQNERLRYLKNRAREIAKFLIWIIENENIPPFYCSDGVPVAVGRIRSDLRGGVSLVAWSSGNHLALPFFAYGREFLSTHEQSLLGRYVRSYVMYDSPPDTSGMPLPKVGETYLCPIHDPVKVVKPEVAQTFPTWVSSYSSHSHKLLDALSSIFHASATPSHLVQSPDGHGPLVGLSDAYVLNGVAIEADKSISPSITRLPAEATEPSESVVRFHIPVVLIGEGAYKRVLYKALFGDFVSTTNIDEDLRGEVAQGELTGTDPLWLPEVKMEVVVCGRSSSICIWNAWKLYDLVRDRPLGIAPQCIAGGQSRGAATSGGTQRSVCFHMWRDFNHFPHWDNPQEYMKLLAGVV
ncbi:hypothetical protein K474DRAFT_1711474 [Panus rudis PR-1116 ss-1]|nr:hypothetical protein K474DRAFT_1711474 [Panus rudis PR-1116 ss-1]